MGGRQRRGLHMSQLGVVGVRQRRGLHMSELVVAGVKAGCKEIAV